MNATDSTLEIPEEPMQALDKLDAAAASYEVNNLFDILDQAGREHHDALVQVTGNLNLQKAQFRMLPGSACLFRTAAGRA
jgi:hypothetical protein